MAKGPGGRPTKYKPEYCQLLIEHMSSGLSYQSFAGKVSVSIETIYDWLKAHPEFLDAKKIGTVKMLEFYESVGVKGMLGEIPNYNLGTWIFNMKNRFRSIETGAWKDKHEVEHQGEVQHNYNLQIEHSVKEIESDPVLLLAEVGERK